MNSLGVNSRVHEQDAGRLTSECRDAEAQASEQYDGEVGSPALHEHQRRTQRECNRGKNLGLVSGHPPAYGERQKQISEERRGAVEALLCGRETEVGAYRGQQQSDAYDHHETGDAR